MKDWCRKAVWGVGLLLAMGGTAAGAEQRVALVLGNGQYAHGGAAPGVAANISAMAEALRRAGFAVTVAENLDHRGTVAAISRFQDALAEADLGFFYYSGLALSLSAKGFLVPVDAKLASEYDVIFDTIELDHVLREVQRAGRKAVAVFDPVPDHPLAGTLASAMGEAGRSVKPVLTTPAALDNLFVVYAHRPGVAPAAVSGSGPTPFTAALAQNMAKPGVPLRDALAEVARTVVGRSKGAQHPWLQDRLGGDLVLVPADDNKVAAAPLPQSKPEFARVEPPKPEPPKPEPPKLEPPKPAAADIEVEALDEARIVSRDTNLRAAPDTKAPVLTTLRRDSEVKVTGRPRRSDGWLRVEQNGQTGFAHAPNLVRRDEAAARQETAKQEPPAGPAGLTAGIYTMGRATNMFARPTLGARSVRDLEQGQMVTLVETVPDSNWVLVQDRFGQKGYVTAGALAGRAGEAMAERPPAASPPSAVTRGDVDPLDGAVSGSGGSAEIAALPSGSSGGSSGSSSPAEPAGKSAGGGPAGRAAPSAEPAAAAGLAAPYREAVDSARDAAARASSGPNSVAAVARRAGEKARQVQAEARRVAEAGRGGRSTQQWSHQFPNGDLYEGTWARGFTSRLQGTLAKDGVGVYRFANGQTYEGEWKDDQMSGHGVMTFATGDRYEGTFRDNVPNGPGVYHFANGDTYAGEVRRGRVEGYGELAFANGDRYRGMVVDRLPSGHGELVLHGGGRHLGLFRGGVQDGPGAAVASDTGALRPGVWRGATLLRE